MAKAKSKSRTVSEIFTAAKEAHDDVAYADIAIDVSARVGYTVNIEMVRQYHLGLTKQRPNLAVIAAIADFYGLKAAELPADVVELCSRSRAIFDGIGVPSTPPGTRTRNLQLVGVA